MKLVVLFLLLTLSLNAQTLPGTKAIEWPEADLSSRLMDGAHAFVERKIAAAPVARTKYWKCDFSSPEAYAKSVEPNRARLREIIGAVDTRLPAAMEEYGDEQNPALVAETERARIYQVRWPVLEGLWGTGLLAKPKGAAVAGVVVVPDAAQSPEQLCGLAQGAVPLARILAENGCEVLVPVTISREKLKTDDRQLLASDQTHREWIYRQAFHMGRQVIGYEVQTALAAVDWLSSRHKNAGICGYGEGGQTALYAAALDTRLSAALVSGYFDSRTQAWAEPIYRNVWSFVREFGDSGAASLILPRGLVIEHSPVPEITGHKGEWRTPEFASTNAEVLRIETGTQFQKPVLIRADAAFSAEAVARFATVLGIEKLAPLSSESPTNRRKGFSPAARHDRYFREMEGHVQRLVERSEHVRDRAFLFSIMPELELKKWSTEPLLPVYSAEKFTEGAKKFREEFRDDAMGRFDEPLAPFNARTRIVKETDKWTAYDVVLDVFDGFFAWGILVVPKDIAQGERRPVVVTQHGRDGIPRNLLDADKTGYRNVAAALAERGFVTFAPHNLYRGEDRYRWLSRKANGLGCSLFSFIIASHDQITRWLDSLPFADGSRIGFYGLSYGGETAVRVPPLLEKYALSICSGDFNQWTRKVASTHEPFSFMRTIEWEMPYWNLGHTFDYAEMSYLILPRPFMVERGHLDLVGRDQWVAHEYAKVRWLYTQLGLADRTEITHFQGGHSMRQEATFDFLHKHLRWPRR